MKLNEEQYERIASRLDGRPVALSDEELAVADEILRAEKELAPVMPVATPAQAVRLAHRRLAGRPRRRVLKFAYVGAAAAAAAAIVLGLSMLWRSQNGSPIPTTAPQVDLIAWYAPSDAGDGDLDTLEHQIDELEAELLVGAFPSPADVQFDSIETEADNFWLDDPQERPQG